MYLHYKNVSLKGLTEFSLGQHNPLSGESVGSKQLQLQLQLTNK